MVKFTGSRRIGASTWNIWKESFMGSTSFCTRMVEDRNMSAIMTGTMGNTGSTEKMVLCLKKGSMRMGIE